MSKRADVVIEPEDLDAREAMFDLQAIDGDLPVSFLGSDTITAALTALRDERLDEARTLGEQIEARFSDAMKQLPIRELIALCAIMDALKGEYIDMREGVVFLLENADYGKCLIQ
jgi:hypothetical protein